MSCSALNSVNAGNGYAGKNNWHLPTVEEFSTLLDGEKSTTPNIDTVAFPATQTSTDYWTSTTVAVNTTNAWRHGFNGAQSNVKTSSFYVRCVSGLSRNGIKSFTDYGDGTVKDNSTGLIWQKCGNGQTNDTTCSGALTNLSWSSAITYCNSLGLSGKTWRLPNRNELQSIVDYTKTTAPTIDSTIFPNAQSNDRWSSTTYAGNTTYAWIVRFNDGSAIQSNLTKPNPQYVRCVSGP